MKKAAAKNKRGPTLLVDVGNTSTSFGLWRNGKVSCIHAVRGGITNPRAVRAALHEMKAERAAAAMIASVVPVRDPLWTDLLEKEYGITPEFLTSATPLPIGVDYPHPEQIGADRLCDAVGAVARHGAPVAVADFGTALTFDVVNARGAYIGGLIAPGLPLMSSYMHEKTAKLPEVDLTAGEIPAWGDSTENAMRLGALHAHRGAVREIFAVIRKKVGRKTALCATGGYAARAVEGIKDCFIEPDLTLFGLGCIWDYARKTKAAK